MPSFVVFGGLKIEKMTSSAESKRYREQLSRKGTTLMEEPSGESSPYEPFFEGGKLKISMAILLVQCCVVGVSESRSLCDKARS